MNSKKTSALILFSTLALVTGSISSLARAETTDAADLAKETVREMAKTQKVDDVVTFVKYDVVPFFKKSKSEAEKIGKDIDTDAKKVGKDIETDAKKVGEDVKVDSEKVAEEVEHTPVIVYHKILTPIARDVKDVFFLSAYETEIAAEDIDKGMKGAFHFTLREVTGAAHDLHVDAVKAFATAEKDAVKAGEAVRSFGEDIEKDSSKVFRVIITQTKKDGTKVEKAFGRGAAYIAIHARKGAESVKNGSENVVHFYVDSWKDTKKTK